MGSVVQSDCGRPCRIKRLATRIRNMARRVANACARTITTAHSVTKPNAEPEREEIKKKKCFKAVMFVMM